MKNTKLALVAIALAAVAMLSITPAAFARNGGDDDNRNRHASSTNATSTNATSTKWFRGRPAIGKTRDIACVGTAVATREDALIAALDEFTADAKAALQARKTALAAAYAKTDRTEVRNDVRAAWKTYRSTMKTIRAELKADKRAAYSAFKIAARACGGSIEPSDASAPGEEVVL